MALANKNRMPNDSTMAIIQASAFYEHNFEEPLTIHQKTNTITLNQDPETPEKLAKNFTMSNSSSVSSPSSTNSNGLGYYNLSEEGQSVFSFKPDYGNGSLFSFDQTKRVQRNLYPEMIGNHEDEQYPLWEEDLHPHSYHGPPETSSSHHIATAYGGPPMQFGWMNDHQEENTISNRVQEIGRQEIATNYKRPSTGESGQASKKQCVVASKKTKAKCESPSKDPQSIAAKNRRERISERLKILQDLVPNGSKVDLVTMLEKAISYVKFLQLQVKVLATDELWPAQGGKAPDLSEVKDAIDAILASQRDKNSK